MVYFMSSIFGQVFDIWRTVSLWCVLGKCETVVLWTNLWTRAPVWVNILLCGQFCQIYDILLFFTLLSILTNILQLNRYELVCFDGMWSVALLGETVKPWNWIFNSESFCLDFFFFFSFCHLLILFVSQKLTLDFPF